MPCASQELSPLQRGHPLPVRALLWGTTHIGASARLLFSAQQPNFNAGMQPNAVSAASGQMGMPAVSDSNNMGTQLQNAAQMVQGLNGINMDLGFGASQQNDMNHFQQQQQPQQQPPFGQPGMQSQQMQPSQSQPQQQAFNPAQAAAAPSPSTQAGGGPGMAAAAGGAKRDFVGTVRNFMQQRGTPFPPQLSLSFVGPASSNLPGDTKTVELQVLFAAVIQSGGSQRATQIPGFWAVIASRLGLKVGPPDGTQSAPDAIPSPGEVPDRLSGFYRDRLLAFEQFWLSRMPQRQASGQSDAAGTPSASGPNSTATVPTMQAAHKLRAK
ncbi:hypothetical protein [Sporisorium scitamineum]|uniref:ARID domain-containing protein n=1 Tax=Sporisorium scitamineum TaxID=49012 RepID=A0A0F7RWG1_9BASI|nr:hypothetical protein [Sporisorium scitamineum]